MSSNFPELVFSEDEDFTADRLNSAMQVLDQRLRALEPFTPSWQQAVNDLRDVGLSRLNDAILPAYNRIQLLSTLGFLFAGSSSEVTLTQDMTATFVIDDETQKSLFTPTPFLALTRSSTVDDWAIAQLISYEAATGTLMVLVKTINGDAGPHTDWQIGACAATTIAAMSYFAQIDSARTTVNAAKAATAADRVQTGQDRIQTGTDRLAASQSAAAAAQSALNAQTWNPAGYATITYVNGQIAAVVAAAPSQLDTINELAAALGNDANYAATVTASLGNRLRIDVNNQGLTTTQQGYGRINLGLGTISTKNIATPAEIRNNTNAGAVTVDGAWAAAGWVDVGNSGSGNINIDCSLGSRFKVTLTGNVTVNFINQKDGQTVDIQFVQDATGGRTLSWNANTRFPNNVVPTVFTTANNFALIFTGVYSANNTSWLAAAWKVN
jgi:hypothetical protein